MYKFTMDFDPDNLVKDNFVSIFRNHGVPNTVIEIGVFEGKTTTWLSDTFTKFNPSLLIHAIDPHQGSVDLSEFDFTEIRQNFLHNIKSNTHQNIVFHDCGSTEGLQRLWHKQVTADLIYIDGNHTAPQVLTDLVLSWQLLNTGGVILCDDATWWRYRDAQGQMALQRSPRIAIDYFVHCNFEDLDILRLPQNHQVAFRKSAGQST